MRKSGSVPGMGAAKFSVVSFLGACTIEKRDKSCQFVIMLQKCCITLGESLFWLVLGPKKLHTLHTRIIAVVLKSTDFRAKERLLTVYFSQ